VARSTCSDPSSLLTAVIVTAEPTLKPVICAARAIQIAVSVAMVIFRSSFLSATVRTGPLGEVSTFLIVATSCALSDPVSASGLFDPGDDLSRDEAAVLTGLGLSAHLGPCLQIRCGAYRDRVHSRLRVEAYHETYPLT
jgi:hypothetical protein